MNSTSIRSQARLLELLAFGLVAGAALACGEPSDPSASAPPESVRSPALTGEAASAAISEAATSADSGAHGKAHAPTSAAAPSPLPGCPADWPCDGMAPADASGDLILVDKSDHRLWLFAGSRVIATHSVALGSGGQSQKGYEGDKITPMGTYQVTHIVPKTRWHTYLALDYPREEDKRRYAELALRGEAPAGTTAGSGIAIHGRRADMPDGAHKLIDWTLGCVALDNAEIDAIAARIKKGAKVVIRG